MTKITLDSTGYDIFVVVDGVKIAKRGRPGTPEAGTWVSLVAGWEVQGLEEIEIRHHGVSVH